MESIAEMRKICQVGRESAIYKMNWFDRSFSRRLSIYLTKFFLKMGMNANDVTFVDLLFVIGAGACFLNPSPVYWMGGITLFLLYLVVDCSDGEVARYNEAKGKRSRQGFGFGSLLGGVVDWFAWPYLFACMGFGAYFATGNLLAFFFGFLAVIMRSLYLDIGLMPYPILHERGMLSRVGDNKANLGEGRAMALGRIAFGVQGFLPAVVAVALVDMFAPSFAFGSQVFNARLVYLAVFGLVALIGVLLKVRDAYKNGVRIQRI